MEKIRKITLKINGIAYVFYEYGGEKFYHDERKVLRKVFKDQGELYEKVFNIDRETARIAGWHPDDRDFSVWCAGWEEFLKNQGKIHKEEIVEEFSVEEFVRNYTGF